MSALDRPVRKVVKTMIRKFGKPAVYRRITSGAYATSTGSASPTASNENVYVVEDGYKAYEIGGSVLAGDKKLLLAPTDEGLTAAPDTSGRFVVDGVVYQIVRIDTVSSGALAGLYQIQVRH